MAQLRRDHQKFIDQGTIIIVIGPENQKQFRAYFTEHDLPFIGIPDPQHSVLKRYGQEVKIFKLGRMPAQVIIDRGGIVRLVHYGKAMSDIPKNKDILNILQQINRQADTRMDAI